MAYHPDTQAFYIPLLLSCEKGTFTSDVRRVEGGGGSGGVKRTNLIHPESRDGIGELLAMNARTGAILWRHRTRTPPNTSALTTGGGLGHRRRLRSLSANLRCGEWRGLVSNAAADVGAGIPDHLRRWRAASRSARAGRHRRRSVGDDDSRRI